MAQRKLAGAAGRMMKEKPSAAAAVASDFTGPALRAISTALRLYADRVETDAALREAVRDLGVVPTLNRVLENLQMAVGEGGLSEPGSEFHARSDRAPSAKAVAQPSSTTRLKAQLDALPAVKLKALFDELPAEKLRAALDATPRARLRRELDALRDEPTIAHKVVTAIIEGGNPIRVWREYRGMTQAQLAAKAPINPTYLSQAENGKPISDKMLRRLAAVLEAPLDSLRGGE